MGAPGGRGCNLNAFLADEQVLIISPWLTVVLVL